MTDGWIESSQTAKGGLPFSVASRRLEQIDQLRASDITALGLTRRLRARITNWWWVVPLAWVVLRSPLRHALSTTAMARLCVTVRLRVGLRVRCRLNEFIGVVEALVLDEYEIPGLDWSGVDSVLDIGANIGASALWFATRAPHARVVAVEPAPAALQLLRENIASNHLESRIDVVPVAVGGEPGWAALELHGASVGTRVIPVAAERIGSVALVSLGELIANTNLEHIGVLKLDCEGAEFDILLGAPNGVLDRVTRVIGEYHRFNGRDPDALRSRLEAGGFAYSAEPHPREPLLGKFTAWRRATSRLPSR